MARFNEAPPLPAESPSRDGRFSRPAASGSFLRLAFDTAVLIMAAVPRRERPGGDER